jgi:hypothetical protein
MAKVFHYCIKPLLVENVNSSWQKCSIIASNHFSGKRNQLALEGKRKEGNQLHVVRCNGLKQGIEVGLIFFFFFGSMNETFYFKRKENTIRSLTQNKQHELQTPLHTEPNTHKNYKGILNQ